MSFRALILFFLLFSFIPWIELSAADTGVSGTGLEFYRPSVDPYGFFGVNGPRLMKGGEFFFKVSQDVAGNSLLRLSVNKKPVDIVNRIATTDFIASMGVNRFLTIALDIPVHFYADEGHITTLESFTTRSLGDLRMALKFRVLEEKRRVPGLAFLFTNSFSTGEETKFLGSSQSVPGVTLIAGKDFEYFSLAVNGGLQIPETKTVLGVDFSRQVTYAAAMKVPFDFWDKNLAVMGEVSGHLQPNDVRVITSPLEYTVGLRKDFENGLSLTGGGGGGWNNAIGNPRWRGVLALGYSGTVRPADRASSAKLPITLPIPPLNLRGGEGGVTVYFPLGSVRPTTESIGWIREFAESFKGPDKILVEGHADSEGSDSWNLTLSRRRAAEVKKILVREGVDPRRIETTGLGETNPVASNETASGRRLNRRAEIRIE